MESIAIIGTGIAGMGCAHFLHKQYNIDLYEQNNYVGGHTNTVYVQEGDHEVAIDTGFIVFNDHTYPNLIRLFKQLDVEVKPTNMSFSVQDVASGLEYSSLHLFAQRKNIFNVKFVNLIFEINRFYKEAEQTLSDERYVHHSLRDYVKEKKYSDTFVYRYLVPMSSALWSTPIDTTLNYPVRVLVQFFRNHGLLGINTQFQWSTVTGGSWQYRNKLIAPFKNRIQLNAKIKLVARENGKVKIILVDGTEKVYDKVIIASHADQALRMLKNPTDMESKLLGLFEYQKNVATLHTDSSIMPKVTRAWSAWNYRVQHVDGELKATTVYDMNILQGISNKVNYFESINDHGLVDPAKVLRRIEYEHPIFTPKTAEAQKNLYHLNASGPVYFCGSYFRFGFHEDALTSSVNLCKQFLKADPWEN